MAQLSALLGSELKSKTGNVPTVDALAGKHVIGLYFSAHWCGPCRHFTPTLAAAYKAIKASGKEFEIVFVSSDRDEGAFDSYYNDDHPWLALPYAARDLKASLSKKYKVSGIPTLVLLDGEGKTITLDGRETLTEDPTGADFPWAKKSVLELLGGLDGSLLSMSGDGDDVKVGDIWGKKKIGLYFSAHWCGPCKAFTPKLVSCYKQLGRDDFEIIFVSSDRSTAEFGDYFKSMPWLAIPPGDARKAKLSAAFGVQGIPTFVMLAEDGSLLNLSARGAVEHDPKGEHFPWEPEPSADLDAGPDGLNENACVIALLEGLSEAARTAAIAELNKVAASTLAAAKAAGEEPPHLFFHGSEADGPVTSQVRKLVGLSAKPTAGVASLLVLDIPDEGGFYASEATQVTEASVRALIDDYASKKLPRKQLSK